MSSSVLEIPSLELQTIRASNLSNILSKRQLIDVTITNDKDEFHAHKLILSTMSPILRKILMKNIQQHTVLFLRNTKSILIKAMIDFIYTGRAEIEMDEVRDFVSLGIELQIEGIVKENENNEKENESNEKEREDYENENEDYENENEYYEKENEDSEKENETDEIENEYDDEKVDTIDEFMESCYPEETVADNNKTVKKEFLLSNVEGLKEYLLQLRNSWSEHNGQFLCEKCGKTSAYKKNIEEHVKKIHLKFKYNCKICLNVNTSIKELRSHICLIEEEKKSEALKRKSELNDEEKKQLYNAKQKFISRNKFFQQNLKKCYEIIEESSKYFTCRICMKNNVRKSHALDHSDVHIKFNWTCFCGKLLRKRGYAIRHLPCAEFIDHWENAGRPITALPDKETFDANALSKRETINVDEYETYLNSFISKQPEDPLNLNPWKCNDCVLKYSSRKDLIRHAEETHIKNTISCDICPEIFKTYASYSEHKLKSC